MRHDQPTTPFDVEADELTEQFWGTTKGWVSSEQPTVTPRTGRTARRDDTTGSLRAIRDGFAALRPQTSSAATGEMRRQRHHGVPQRTAAEAEVTGRREATLGELAAGRSDVGGWLEDEWPDDRWEATTARHDRIATPEHAEQEHTEPEYDVPLSPVQPLVERLGLGAVDPLLVRGGMIALALILLVPLMLSLRPDRTDTLPGDVVEVPQPAGAATGSPLADPAGNEAVNAGAAGVDATVAAPAGGEASAEPSTEAATAAPSGDPDAADTAVTVAESADEQSPTESTGTADEQSVRFDAAAVDIAAERVVPACPQTYTAAAGDSWYRIADAAGVSPRELLAQNNATTATVILPGDEVCLPEGATVPSAPVAPTTTAPADEQPSTTAPSTTTAPTSTVAPLSRGEVQELIRATWPEEEVATALAVAERESNFVATADNGWCCVGVFQLYWTVHRGWLDDFGITERSHLFDARKNIAAAFHMWQTQGWGPWNV